MKWKQILLIVGISAVSAVTSVFIYGKITGSKQTSFMQTANGNLPVNYAGFFDNAAGAGEPVDFTKAANTAVPAVVHIKTKIAAKKINNQLPRNNRSNSMEDMFEQFFNNNLGTGYSLNKEPPAVVLSSAMMDISLPTTMWFLMAEKV